MENTDTKDISSNSASGEPTKQESRYQRSGQRSATWDFKARGEPFVWSLGGALAIGVLMIVGFVSLILYNGFLTFYPRPILVVELKDGSKVAGDLMRTEVSTLSADQQSGIGSTNSGKADENPTTSQRMLLRTGNFDLYNEDFKWVGDHQIANKSHPKDILFVERLEWGPFIGFAKSMDLNGKIVEGPGLTLDVLDLAVEDAALRRQRILEIERSDIGAINHFLEKARLALKRVELRHGLDSPEYASELTIFKAETERLNAQYQELASEAAAIKQMDSRFTISLEDVNGKPKNLLLSQITRLHAPNNMLMEDKIWIYLSRWIEFLTQEPREANTEGGVMPAIFGTFCMTVLMALAVAPFGVIGALYLREYAKQGKLVSLIRICVNNLAGVPSIVYGVFGLGFFAYILGGSIDGLFFPERLPNPTFGTGGLLWASLTLALLTVPVVIVATEEALAAVPQSMREGSLACGASKWQTIKWIVLPRAMPGIMTGLILAMARGAEEVAPLMLVGVVKMAPELPIDSFFPFIHLERSFMHLGFHIFDLGFQSRNSEAALPMVYVTTMLLITLVFAMNIVSIIMRNRLKRKFFTGHF